jgi:NAD(P)-dependent dehydrogenase (short-subunit alcohol dehydrogenase family)
MTARLFIVTGASRGLGRAIAEQLLQPGHRVLTLSRRPDPALAGLATARGAVLEDWAIDLADAPAAAARLAAWLAAQAPADAALINNAALLSAPAPLRAGDLAELSAALRVGLEAPLLLTSAFLRATEGWGTDRRVLNVSSGLGRRALAGSASYCAVKAGMDHFSRAVALEEAGRAGGARIVSLAPGIVDTDMQLQLRGADRGLFPAGQVFVGYHAQGQLDSPAAAAAKVLRFLDRPDFGADPIGDVRQG